MGRSIGLSLALAALLVSVACGGEGATGLALGGSGTTVITVSSGTTPSISWSGGNARRLTITQASGGGVFWDLEALNASGFVAPVLHGVVPNGARENSNDAALTGGTDYRVNITLVDGTEGTRVFRP
jgi:hypothetical protein